MSTLVKRSKKLAFYGVPGELGQVTFHRAIGFTDLSISKNPIEYSRQYVDMEFEETDVTGYSPSIAYAFDQHSGDAVHEDIIQITDGELIGKDAVRSIIIVDMTTAGKESDSFKAVKRDFSVIPDSEGDSMDAYTYSGTFKVKGEKIFGEAKSEDDWQTITFSEAE